MSEQPEGLSPEQREQVERAMSRARSALGNVSRSGVLGLMVHGIFQGIFRSMVRRLRVALRGLAYLGVGLLVAALSVTTCSAGIDLAFLTAEYGEPVPASKEAAKAFLERSAAAIQGASANRRVRITVSESEATSVLSLGLLIPELMRAMESLPQEAVQGTDDIEELRQLIREREASRLESRTFRERVAGVLDPRLRTGDVQVRFTGNGEIVVAGYVQAWRWQQPALVVFAPRARRGELQLDFVRGRLGRVSAPAFAFDLLGELAGSLIMLGQDYSEISEITVEQGRMTFEARVNR